MLVKIMKKRKDGTKCYIGINRTEVDHFGLGVDLTVEHAKWFMEDLSKKDPESEYTLVNSVKDDPCKKRCLHLTHNDADALACDLIVHHLLTRITTTTYFCQAGGGVDKTLEEIGEDELSKFDLILITDNSVTVETADWLENIAESYNIHLVMVDHHPTNPCQDRDWCYMAEDILDDPFGYANIPIKQAACQKLLKFDKLGLESYDGEYSANYICKLHHITTLVIAISRYDTWEWKNHPIDPCKYGSYKSNTIPNVIKTLGFIQTVKIMHQFYSNLMMPSPSSKCYPGYFDVIDDAYDEDVEHAKKTIPDYVKIWKDDKYMYASFIGGKPSDNDVASDIFDSYPESSKIDIVEILYPDTKTLSMRSRKAEIDVGSICKDLYGGGGHKQAAGAKVDPITFLSHLEKYYMGDPFEIIFDN